MRDVREQLQRTLGDGYRVHRELGGGGMSRVYAATDTSLGRSIVVKVLAPELAAGVSVERFQREIQLAARLQHAYIVPLLSAGTADNLPYYTMPLVDGESLRHRLDRTGELPVADAVKVLRDLAEALCYAHEQGIVHRDIKPENVLLTSYHALVTDFGVAKAVDAATKSGSGLTSVGVALGTPAYMAPEQAAADPATDHRADIYSFGAVAYEMLTGRQVFGGRSPGAMMAAHAAEPPQPIRKVRPNIPPAIASLVMRCLEKRPADRPQTARELVDTLESASTTGAAAALPSARHALFHRPLLLGAAAAVVIAAIAAAVFLRPREAVAVESKLVVLPFDNLGQAGDQYFAEGLAEEITNRLTRVPGIVVVARGSSAQLKRSGRTAQQIARELDADFVLDGTVRWARLANDSSLVRVTPALIDVARGVQVWGEPYEAVLARVFALQSDIAEEVANALKVKLSPRQVETVRASSTTNVAAFDAYLGGRHQWKRRTPQSLWRAISEFEKAVALDPRFARAWAGLADSYTVLPVYVDTVPATWAYERAERAIQRALELDQQLAEAHAGLGQLRMYQWDYAGSVSALKRALELDPTYATGHQWLCETYMFVGRFSDAVSECGRAVALEPAVAVIAWAYGWSLYLAGRFEDAESETKRALILSPTAVIPHRLLSSIYMATGRPRQAIAEFEALGMPPHVAQAFVRPATRSDTAAMLRLARDSRSSFLAAGVYVNLGMTDSALAAIARVIAMREHVANQLKTHPFFRPLRGDPRFEELLARVNLTDAQLRRAGLRD